MLTFEEQSHLVTKSREALNRINSNRMQEVKEQASKGWKKPNYAKIFMEEYTDSAFAEKIKLDAAYYNVLLRRLDESQSDAVHSILIDLNKVVRKIYEHINLKPKVYGIQRLPNFNQTDNTIEESATRIISDFVNRNYYALNRDQRYSKYGTEIKSSASKMMINEGISGEDAVIRSTKVVVVKQLLENINFPMVIRGEIETCLTSKEYGEMFEQEKLQDLWEKFEEKSHNLANIVASVV